MIRELFEMITGLNRSELIITRNGEYIYDDSKKSYQRVDVKPFDRTICNVDSFALAVLEEARRGKNATGDHMTVIFDEAGGDFYSADELAHEQNKWNFERRYTHLWKVIKSLVGTKLNHRQLLDSLDSVKNCIPGFEKLYQTISKLRASKKIQFVSNPIFADGEQAGFFAWEQKIDSNATTETAVCPSEISFKGKIVRGSETEYEFALALTPMLDEENGRILFGISMPGYDMVLDQVREDEYQVFCEKVKGLTDLLILRNH